MAKSPPVLTQDPDVVNFHNIEVCYQCGIADTAPKSHYAKGAEVLTRHLDCLPVAVVAEMIAGGHSQHPLITARILKACRDEGIKDQDLRDLITSQQMSDYGDAQMLKYTTFANDVLDATLQNGASGTYTLGVTTYTLPLKIRFLSTLSVAATPGTEWSTSGGYTAGGVALNGLLTAAASAAAKANTGAVTVTNAPAQTWADNDIRDATGTPKNIVFKGTPSLGKTVNSGDTCTIAIGNLTGSET